MLQEASNGALWNVLRGRFAAPQDEGMAFGSGYEGRGVFVVTEEMPGRQYSAFTPLPQTVAREPLSHRERGRGVGTRRMDGGV